MLTYFDMTHQLLRYVQQSETPPFGLSPYLFVLLIFIAPVAQSVCNQAALYRVAQLGLRLRAVLGHAIYAKLLRIKAGGGSSKQGEEGDEERKHSGGSQAVGRVNSQYQPPSLPWSVSDAALRNRPRRNRH